MAVTNMFGRKNRMIIIGHLKAYLLVPLESNQTAVCD